MLNAFAPIFLVYLCYTISNLGSSLVGFTSPVFSAAWVLLATILLEDLGALDLYVLVNGLPQLGALVWIWPFIALTYAGCWYCARTGRTSGPLPRTSRRTP